MANSVPLVGVNFIGVPYWDSYQLPAFTAMKPTLAKFNMFYDGSWTTPAFGSQHLDAAVNAGAKVVIFRTAETKISPDEVDRQLNTPIPGWNKSLLEYVKIHPTITFIVEVGNEPDQSGQQPPVHRWALINTARALIPKYRTAYPNLQWIASMPTANGGNGISGPDWFNAVMFGQGDDLGSLADAYDGFGVHNYGYNTLFRNDGNHPWAVADWVIGASTKPIWITESGINSRDPWWRKCELMVQALASDTMPPQAKGVAYFTLSRDAEWFSNTNYAIDVDQSGSVDYSWQGAKIVGGRPGGTVIVPPPVIDVPVPPVPTGRGWRKDATPVLRSKGMLSGDKIDSAGGEASMVVSVSPDRLNRKWQCWFEDIGMVELPFDVSGFVPRSTDATTALDVSDYASFVHGGRLKIFVLHSRALGTSLRELYVYDTGYQFYEA